MVERLSEAMGAALVCKYVLPIPLKISFHMKISDLLLPDIYKTLNLFESQTESVSLEWLPVFLKQACCCHCLPAETAKTWKHPVFDLTSACSTSPSCAGALPQELGHWFLELGLKLELCLLTNRLKRLYLLRSPKINCVEFKFFLGLLKTPKLRTAVSWYPQDWANHQFLKNLEEFIQFDQIFQTAIICFGRFC